MPLLGSPGLGSVLYVVAASVLGLGQLALAGLFWHRATDVRARFAPEGVARLSTNAAGNATARPLDLSTTKSFDRPGQTPAPRDMAHAPVHGHGHVTLHYQPALPIGRGKLCLWLFLSTEIMFFAGLIGTYIVLRFGAPPNSWPAPHDVHLQEYVGAFNTFVLICSSVTIVLALEASKGNHAGLAKFWMILTFLLGSVFLGVKGYEYNEKFKHGIYPAKPHSRLYEKPDLYYIQGTKLVLAQKRAQLDSQKAALEIAKQENDKLNIEDRVKALTAEIDKIANLQTNLVQWTELKAARDDDPLARRLAMDKLAKAIYPHWPLGKEGEELEHLYMESLKDEERQINHDLVSFDAEHDKLQKEKDAKVGELDRLQKAAKPQEKTTDVSPAGASGNVAFVALQNQPAADSAAGRLARRRSRTTDEAPGRYRPARRAAGRQRRGTKSHEGPPANAG